MTSVYFMGIDPGLHGAIAVLDAVGEILLLEDMPTVEAGKGKREVCGLSLSRLVSEAWMACMTKSDGAFIVRACLEAVHAMPKQGVSSSFRFGDSFGVVKGVLAAKAIPYATVTPQRWQKVALDGHGRGDKSASLLVARRRWPSAGLARKSDDGRADALLIAEWARVTSLSAATTSAATTIASSNG